MHRMLILVLVCAVPALPDPVLAEGNLGEAKAAFKEGKKLFAKGEFEAAAAAFRRAHDLKPNWKLLYNLGQSEAASKRYGLAIQAFERYLAEGGDEVRVRRRDNVLAEIGRLRVMVGSVEVAGPEGAVVAIDGEERGTTPLPGLVLVSAGVEHRIDVRLDDVVLVDRVVVLTGGQQLVVEAKLPEAPVEEAPIEPVAPVAEESDEADDGAKLRTAGWITGGIGAAIAVGGVITGSMALSIDGDLEQACADGGCPPAKRSDRDRMNVLAPTTDVLIGVGAAAVLAGVVLIIVGSRGEDEDAETVAIVPCGRGAAIVGRF